MREMSYVLGLLATYAGVAMLLAGHALPEFRETSQPLTLGLMVVGCLLLFWHVAGLQSKTSLQQSAGDNGPR
jgi:hypothetical protein